VSPLVPVELPGLTRTTYRAYPIPDHIADKVCGVLELHPRVDGPPGPSTRYRDLVDLATFAHTMEVEADALVVALASEVGRRGLELPDRLPSLTGSGWPAGYARVARDAPGLAERDLRAAMSTVGRFIDPVLSGDASGRWDSRTLRWMPVVRRR
jgi:Nucleotidyl transferase AbiEii toxin, Type IV TA system